MRDTNARLNQIEAAIEAKRLRESWQDSPLLIVWYEGEPKPSYPDNGTGRGPLIIRRKRRDSIDSEGPQMA